MSSPFVQGLLLAGGTLILEDPSTVAGGLLVASGQVSFLTAWLGLSLGIAAGDLGLFGLGRLFGERVRSWRWIDEEKWKRGSRWLGKNLSQAVVLSRFVPGARLPTYLAAGALETSFAHFATVAILASTVWATLLLSLTIVLGEAIHAWIGSLRWVGLGLVLMVILLPSLLLRLQRDRAVETDDQGRPLRSSFEFWSPAFFYVPVAFKYVGLALRYRSLTLPTAVNPSIYAGGLIRESKSEILALLPKGPHLPPFVRVRSEGAGGLSKVKSALEGLGLDYPFVAKPDQGQRGEGVQLIRDEEQLVAYLSAFPKDADILFQELIDHPMEAGIFYVRDPKTGRGRILSVTLKEFPSVEGDGRSTLTELIRAHPRARHTARVYERRHADRLLEVLAAGERLPLVFAGNHCQGAVFRDGRGLVTPELVAHFDQLADKIPGFDFGRFDIRFKDVESFKRGECYGIVELNGVGAEATHIWDPEARLGDAYRALFEQFEIAFAIGARNRSRGVRPLGAWALVRELFAHARVSQAYPPTN
ncbi:MAG: VTT domain-containing protein [Myxococcota bacterium]